MKHIKKKVYVPIIIYHKWISIFCNACGHDGFVQIMVTTYWLSIYICLTFYSCLLHLKWSWKKFLPFALGILLDFITIWYYKNAFECILKATDWFYSILLIVLRGCFEVSCVHNCNANCTSNFLSPIWNVLYLCKYLYLPYNIYV